MLGFRALGSQTRSADSGKVVLGCAEQLLSLDDRPYPGGQEPGFGEVVDPGTEDDRGHTGLSQPGDRVVGGVGFGVNAPRTGGVSISGFQLPG